MQKFFVISFAAFLSLSFTSNATPVFDNPVEEVIKDPYVHLVQQLTKYAKKFMGVPYVWGGTQPNGFDCSGFVRYVFARFDMPLSHNSRQLSEIGYDVDIQQAYVGDLIFFSTSRRDNAPVGHVGIIVSNDEDGIRFIHASTSRGVTYDYLSESYFTDRFVGVKRVIDALKDFGY
ncbi:MAG: cell wall-associated NlpC family hydrolase [Spirosomataceae bacterium]|jgi:cell wall-associated NlpC family hydrolase